MKTKLFILIFILFINNLNFYSQINMIPNGFVGIGTPTPACNLTINGTGTVESLIATDGFSSSRSILSFAKDTKFWNLGMNLDLLGSDDLHFRYGTTNTLSYIMTLTSNSYVGIGTTSPQYKLDVNGDIATYGSLLISSDERVKENIKPLTNCLNDIKKINGKSYYKKITISRISNSSGVKPDNMENTIITTDTIKQSEYGVIAQDVQKVFPELVKADSSGMLSVNYIGLIPVLIEALKQQQVQIDSLKRSVSVKSGSLKNALVDPSTNLENFGNASLSQNYPNPFSSTTTIDFYIPGNSKHSAIYIYDLQGIQKKAYNITSLGKTSITINGYELPAGMYLYSLIIDNQIIDTKRMVLTE
jgi:hypothetical protein